MSRCCSIFRFMVFCVERRRGPKQQAATSRAHREPDALTHLFVSYESRRVVERPEILTLLKGALVGLRLNFIPKSHGINFGQKLDVVEPLAIVV